jgi:hypothetical protein
MSETTQKRLSQLAVEQVSLRDSLGRKLLERAEEQKHLTRIRIEWIKRYGRLYHELEGQRVRVEIASKRLELLETVAPGASPEEIDELLRDAADRMERELEEIDGEISLAESSEPLWLPTIGGVVDEDQLTAHREQIKSVLMELWLLLHPDRLEQHPAYHLLSPQLRQELEEIRRRTPPPRAAELRYSPNQVGYHLPNLGTLLLDLNRARQLLAVAGLPLNDNPSREMTPEERTHELEGELDFLRQALREAEIELIRLREDPETIGMRHDLQPEVREGAQARLEQRIAQYRAEADSLEAELEHAFHRSRR